MAYTTGAFYVTGGTAAALTTTGSWPHPDPRTTAVLVLAAIAVTAGAALLRWGRSLPHGAYHPVVVQGALLVATAVVLSRDDVTALAIAGIFVFCAIDNLYFFARRAALAHTALLLAAVAGSLLWRQIDPGVVGAVMIVQVAVVAVIGRLVQRAAHGTRDGLTDLLNRRGLDERVEERVEGAHRAGAPLAVALIDIDHFKQVNDLGGHAAGDELLVDLAGRLSARLHALVPAAALARHGGDEFAVVLPGTDLDGAQDVAQALRAEAAPTGLSIGVAQLRAGEDPATLMRRADSALYEAKAAGRGRVAVAGGVDEGLLEDLRTALREGTLQAVLQPVVVPGAGPGATRLVGVEALARWTHPVRGPVSPAVFIPLAEANDLIADLDRVVIRRACADAVELRRAVGQDLFLTVNASGRHLVDPDFLQDLLATATETGWPLSGLVVEVTESTVESASDATRDTLEELRAVGVRVAIDDFGTGYSALSQLDTMPADFLKLDAHFTAQLTVSDRRRALLAGLLRMSTDLGLVVIAEGVETGEQEQALLALGCPLAQGYWYQRPQPVADLVRALHPDTPVVRSA
ncbi:putative bifunctional diguanylate cyclase/phosphodiesterase [Kineococcus sp. LSe6-4]|uniref:Bifunctional diguanylate cyclase/phosphodiesterase n=1 Tax=Kineococcus halophytocola TaxID=3234027 RepID=A0ABV4H2N5_9ACTN